MPRAKKCCGLGPWSVEWPGSEECLEARYRFGELLLIIARMIVMIISIVSLSYDYCVILISVLGILRSDWLGYQYVTWGLLGDLSGSKD